jgi:hypothetical protein
MRNLSHDCNQASNLIWDLQEKYDEQELLMNEKRGVEKDNSHGEKDLHFYVGF